MRKIALGRLRMPAREFGLITLAELYDAISGHEEERRMDLQGHLWGVRRQIFYQLASIPGMKHPPREEDIIPLEMDEELRTERHRSMPLMIVTVNGQPE